MRRRLLSHRNDAFSISQLKCSRCPNSPRWGFRYSLSKTWRTIIALSSSFSHRPVRSTAIGSVYGPPMVSSSAKWRMLARRRPGSWSWRCSIQRQRRLVFTSLWRMLHPTGNIAPIEWWLGSVSWGCQTVPCGKTSVPFWSSHWMIFEDPREINLESGFKAWRNCCACSAAYPPPTSSRTPQTRVTKRTRGGGLDREAGAPSLRLSRQWIYRKIYVG